MLNLVTSSDLILLFIIGAVMTAVLMLITGCHGVPLPTPTPKPRPIPPSLDTVNAWLDTFAVLSVLGVAAALVLFFLLPEAHRASITLGVAGGSVLAVSLLVKVTLPFVPWIAGAFVAIAIGFLIYEIVYKVKTGTFDKPGDGKGNL